MPGAVFDYSLGEPLGQDEITVTYRAQRAGGPAVALRIVHPHLAGTCDPSQFERAAARLAERRPAGLVTPIEHGTFEGRPYAVTALPAETLRDRLARDFTLPTAEAQRLARSLAAALSDAAALGLDHAGLTPSDVHISPDGEARLAGAEFSSIRAQAHRTSARPATSHAAPECAQGRCGPQSELYALGAALAEAVTGHAPGTQAIESSDAAELRARDATLAEVIERLTHRDATRRLRTPREVLDVLDGARRSLMPWRWRRAVSLVAGVGALAVAATIAIVVIATRGGEGGARVGVWTAGPDLTVERAQASVFVVEASEHTYLYVAGGGNGPAWDTVERAEIRKDGSLGPFAVVDERLPEPRVGMAAFTRDGYVFLVGGWNNHVGKQAAMANYRAAIDEDTGDLGPWEEIASRLAEPVSGGSLAMTGDDVFLVGGTCGSVDVQCPAGPEGFRNFVQHARITARGELSNFGVLPSPLTERVMPYEQAALIDGYMYIFGGAAPLDAEASATIERAAVGDGGLGPWSVAGELPAPRSMGAVAVASGRVFVIGGYKAGPSVIFDAVLAADTARPTEFRPESTLPAGVQSMSVVAHDEHLYVVGGSTATAILRTTYVYAVPSAPRTGE